MSSPSSHRHSLYDVATLPGMDQTVAMAIQIIDEFAPNVKVCKARCRQLAKQCSLILFEFRDKVDRDSLKGAEYARMEEKVSGVIEYAYRKSKKLSRMARFKSWLLRRSVKKGLENVFEQLDSCLKDLQTPIEQRTPIIMQQPTRHDTILDISNVNDFSLLSASMQTMQTELRRPSVGLAEQSNYQRQLSRIYRETQILPPLADLSGQLTKTSEEPIAYGRYNDVYEGMWLKDIKVALKFARAVNHTAIARRRFMKEVEIWRDLQHPHVSRFLGIVNFGSQMYSVSIWMENNDALKYINSTEEVIDRLRILRDVSSGMEYLHFRKVVHGDLRARNILIDANGNACVSDFGLSIVAQSPKPDDFSATYGDSPVRWQARELVKPDDYGGHVPISFQTDVWSFGMLCLVIMTGKKPYNECQHAANVIENLVEKHLPERPVDGVVVSRGLDTRLWNLLLACWRWVPSERPSMVEIHRWLKALKPGRCEVHESNSLPQKGPMEHLQKLLSQLEELNLTSKDIEIKSVKAVGGYSDVLDGCWRREVDGKEVTIAIKRLRINLRNDLSLARKIAREIRVWALLHHENILPFLGFIMEYEVYPSLVTEWMENGTVMEYVNRQPDTDIVPLVEGIASGLAYLHHKSIVHGDMKSANIMMSKAGKPLIMDFGISHLLQSTTTVETATASTKGSIRWMAIELFRGPGQVADGDDEVDADEGNTVHTTQSDVWAFGMTVYELLSRNVPYYALKIDAQVMFAIISKKLPELTVESYGWSRGLRRIWSICNKCWSPEPGERPTMYLVLKQIQEIN